MALACQEVDVKMIETLFKKALDNSLCNTSYPLNKTTWKEYRKNNYDLFLDETELCFYIHIPFCKSLCSFCEYVKYKKEPQLEEKYLEILENDINNFIESHNIKKLYGFDVGGGTPTSLEIDNFKKLMEICKKINNNFVYVNDYEPSIEATFNTITEEKIRLIKESGFTRISLGVQTLNTKILLDNNRDVITVNKMLEIVNLIKKYNIKVNLDLIYGLPNQKIEDIENSIKIINIINPNQVTLYEMRYNMLSLKSTFSKDDLYKFYEIFYKNFISMGYNATFGQNTFSKTDDLGLSSYLRYRMIENISYKGFGISAQSKSSKGLSYNVGKAKTSFDECIKKSTFFEEDIYLLPKEEMLAKYIAVSMYYGQFKLSIMENIISINPLKKFNLEFKYLIDNGYVLIDGDLVKILPKGFKYFGAIGALFYSDKSKKIIMEEL